MSAVIAIGLLAVVSAVVTARAIPVGDRLGTTSNATVDPDVVKEPLPLYDTAWMAPTYATLPELAEYFDHLSSAGYEGSMMWLVGLSSVFPERKSTVTGGPTDRVEGGRLTIDPGHTAHLRAMLDAAAARGLKIAFAPAWEQDSVCGGHAKRPTVLDERNAYEYGVAVAAAVGRHPAVSLWLFGGDAETGPDGKQCYADVEVWRQMAAALRDNGARQPIGFHTARGTTSPALQPRHVKWADEPWVDVLMPQTGQCNDAATSASQLGAAVARGRALGKPTYSIEMRYESTKGRSPSFCSLKDPSVSTDDLRSDAIAAREAGATLLAYGHHDRWTWGVASHDPSVASGGGFAAVRASFGSPGERAYLDER